MFPLGFSNMKNRHNCIFSFGIPTIGPEGEYFFSSYFILYKNAKPNTNLSLSSTLQYTDSPGHNVAREKETSSSKQEKLSSIHMYFNGETTSMQPWIYTSIDTYKHTNYYQMNSTHISLTEKKLEASSSPSALVMFSACLRSRRAINCQETDKVRFLRQP